MSRRSIQKFFNKYVRNTQKNTRVSSFKIELTPTVILSTRALKHVYDKRPAQEFDFFIKNLQKIITNPDQVYLNKSGKRGNLCLIKIKNNEPYLCLLENISHTSHSTKEVVTFFRSNWTYIRDYELLWERKDGNLHRNELLRIEQFTPQ